jgi:hypothetical protein
MRQNGSCARWRGNSWKGAKRVLITAAPMVGMTANTIIRKSTTGEPGNKGQFGRLSRDESAATLVIESAPNRIQSEFIDSSIIMQEAAASYVKRYPNATAEDVENELFDTWDTEEEFARDAADPDSNLGIMGDSAVAEKLPSGGIAVFWG